MILIKIDKNIPANPGKMQGGNIQIVMRSYQRIIKIGIDLVFGIRVRVNQEETRNPEPWKPNAIETGNELLRSGKRTWSKISKSAYLPLVAFTEGTHPGWWVAFFSLLFFILVYFSRENGAELVLVDENTYMPQEEDKPKNKPKDTNRGVDLGKVHSWSVIEGAYVNMTYHDLATQKKYWEKIGGTEGKETAGRIRNLQRKYWEKAHYFDLHKEAIKALTPEQVKSFSPIG